MSVSTAIAVEQPADAPRRGAEYPVYGHALTGGAYNSHLVSIGIVVGLAALGLVNLWLTWWLVLCLAAAMLADARSWGRKVALRAMPGQVAQYAQVLARACWDALPQYVFAYAIYVCTAPIVQPLNLAVSSFVMLYGFYMTIRLYWVVRYLWVLAFRFDSAGRTLGVREANLKSRGMAIRHVIWSYFLGNIGLVIRCASQVLTIGLFEMIRTRTDMDLTRSATFSGHLTLIFVIAAAIWAALFYFSVKRALLIYYRAHRTFHNTRSLYDSIHSIHHRGVFPTPLDSGTISPFEFLITEMAIPAGTLVPNWWFTAAQIVLAYAGHLPSHDTGTRIEFARHHLDHHRFFNVNFGLTPAEDAKYGTLHKNPDVCAESP